MAELLQRVSWGVVLVTLFTMVSQIDNLSIIKHEAKPSIVTNCSSVRLTCLVDVDAPDVEVWWTFGAENATKLPNVTIVRNITHPREWELEISCATLVHKGSYVCNARIKNESEVVYRKETILQITVPAVIQVGQAVTAEFITGQVNLTCSVHAYPLASVNWLKGGEMVNVSDGHFQITKTTIDNATVLSTLYIDALERQDIGTYICLASNGFDNSSETQDLIVQEPERITVDNVSVENSAAMSNWNSVNVPLPPDVPPKVSWVLVLAATNDTLLFGWRQPNRDNGANITHYVVQLRHNGVLMSNKTKHVRFSRHNQMYIFLSLEPGETYSFIVQACNDLGCGNWSQPLEGTTFDGFADPPRNIEVKCEVDLSRGSEFIKVTWDIPENARGTIQSYNLTISSTAKFIDEYGDMAEKKTVKVKIIDVKTNQLEYVMEMLPNPEYTVQMCTVNRSGCGPLSNITANTRCMSAIAIPSVLPGRV